MRFREIMHFIVTNLATSLPLGSGHGGGATVRGLHQTAVCLSGQVSAEGVDAEGVQLLPGGGRHAGQCSWIAGDEPLDQDE